MTTATTTLSHNLGFRFSEADKRRIASAIFFAKLFFRRFGRGLAPNSIERNIASYSEGRYFGHVRVRNGRMTSATGEPVAPTVSVAWVPEGVAAEEADISIDDLHGLASGNRPTIHRVPNLDRETAQDPDYLYYLPDCTAVRINAEQQ